MLFTDSADKASRFIWLCDAFSIPLVYLADVPGFMIGTEVERGGIIRHGAKMVSAVASATVPQFCVVVRKAYGAGLYAMGGPGFGPGRHDRAAHRPDRRDGARGGGQRGLRQQDRRGRAQPGCGGARRVRRRASAAEYEEDVDLERLAADLVLDGVVEADELRAELLHRLRYASRRDRAFSERRRSIPPV